MPPHIYPRITPHQVCVCTYFTSAPMYSPYAVTQYPHILYLGYLPTLFSRITSYVLPPHYSKILVNTEGRRGIKYQMKIWRNKELQWVEKMEK